MRPPKVVVECLNDRIVVRPWGPEYPPLFTFRGSSEVCEIAKGIEDRHVLLIFLLLATRLPPQRALELASHAPMELASLVLSFGQLPPKRGTFLGRRVKTLARLYQELLELRLR